MAFSSEIIQAALELKEGRLVAFPTETVYGLGADATNDRAVAEIYAAKGRPSFNPLIAHVAAAQQAFALGVFPPAAEKLALAFWPGPLTIVVPRSETCNISTLASAGLPSIALRVPDHPVAQALLQAVDRPVVAPSANPSGKISPTTAAHVREHLGNKVAMILDGGPARVGLESTIVSFLDGRMSLLRAGHISREQIEQVTGQKLALAPTTSQPHAPGQLASHYAPNASLRLNVEAPQSNETYLGFGKNSHGAWNLSPAGDLIEAAANLFSMLHQLDATGAPHIAVAPIPSVGIGEAINDRLQRAAAPRP